MPTRCEPSAARARVLVVDDNPAIHDDFRKVLTPSTRRHAAELATFRAAFKAEARAPDDVPELGFDLAFASQGEEAIALVEEAVKADAPVALVFLDVRMPPGIDGIETAQRLWALDPDVQIVVCSAYSDYSWEEMVRRLGTGDRWVIMGKPFDPVGARQLATAMVCKWRAARAERLRADELARLIDERTEELRRANAKLRSEMESLERAQAQIDHMAHHDALTDLPNRRALEIQLERQLEEARLRQGKVAVLSVDLDHFKRINDSLGHVAGDEVLRILSLRLRRSIRSSDLLGGGPNAVGTVARFGGDEFTVVLPRVRSSEHALDAARRLEAAISAPMDVRGHEIRVTTSIGVALFPDHGQSPSELLGNAERALYNTKQRGRGSLLLYSGEIGRRSPSQLVVETALVRALDNDELVLHYQPIVEPSRGAILGLESLVRWNHPGRGLLGPGEFLPLAEECGLMGPLGEWVANAACRQARAWQDSGLDIGRMSVNVSATQLDQREGASLVRMIERALESSGLPADRLVIELTETALLRRGLDALNNLAQRGVRIALDDFGTGYSSLKHLVQLPIYALKIDQSFVRDAHVRPQPAAVVKAIIGMARSLGLAVVAEGVETREELSFLEHLGCKAIQGFYFSRPVPAEAVPEVAHAIRDAVVGRKVG